MLSKSSSISLKFWLQHILDPGYPHSPTCPKKCTPLLKAGEDFQVLLHRGAKERGSDIVCGQKKNLLKKQYFHIAKISFFLNALYKTQHAFISSVRCWESIQEGLWPDTVVMTGCLTLNPPTRLHLYLFSPIMKFHSPSALTDYYSLALYGRSNFWNFHRLSECTCKPQHNKRVPKAQEKPERSTDESRGLVTWKQTTAKTQNCS